MSSCNAVSVNCAIRPTNKGFSPRRDLVTYTEIPALPAFEQVPRQQRLAPSRSLVTYGVAFGAAASNSPDAAPATAAPVAHFPGHGSNRGCRVCSTTTVDWPACWRLGSPGWNSIFGGLDNRDYFRG